MVECRVRGIRGAINVDSNTKESILKETRLLLEKMIELNGITKEDICSIFFTATRDINSGFPAEAAREMGWVYVPMLCSVEIEVPGSLPLCVRVLMHAYTSLPQEKVKHVYLKDAKNLRDDLDFNLDNT